MGLAFRAPNQNLTHGERRAAFLDWDDLILPPQTLDDVEGILAWIEHRDTILEDAGLGRFVRPGFRSLFHGPSGSGKTLTAALLGKASKRYVYRIDVSMIASANLGETERNIATLFDEAKANGWILFFNEADAVFGKRTRVPCSNDRYANL